MSARPMHRCDPPQAQAARGWVLALLAGLALAALLVGTSYGADAREPAAGLAIHKVSIL